MSFSRALGALALLLAACGSNSPLQAPSLADGGAPVDAAGAADATAGAADATPDAAPVPSGTRFAGVTAVKGLPAGDGFLVLLETLKTQLFVTEPARELVALDARLATTRRFAPLDGWTLIDGVAHPSGDVTAASVRVDYADPFPLRVQLSRHRPDGSRVDVEVPPVAPPDDLGARFMATTDRVRLVAAGEEVYLCARWSGNAVFAYRYRFGAAGFEAAWATRVEPEAELSVLGIIGGGFDNLHQGDNKLFVYLDVDAAGNAYVAVPSTGSVLEAHDAAFGEHLLDEAHPDQFDFGTAVLTRLDAAGGARAYTRLLGNPGRGKSLLGVRATDDTVLLVGRMKIGGEADGWDAWLLAARAATGALDLERTIDVEHGDMFWDAVPLPGGRVVAVGSTNYSQNPSGLSVSDARDALAVVLDGEGRVLERLALPRSGGGRGDEAISVRVGAGGRLVVAGMLDGPGTHAEVRSDGFLELVDQSPAAAKRP